MPIFFRFQDTVYLQEPTTPGNLCADAEHPTAVNPLKQMALVSQNKEKKKKKTEPAVTPPPTSRGLGVDTPIDKPIYRCSKKQKGEDKTRPVPSKHDEDGVPDAVMTPAAREHLDPPMLPVPQAMPADLPLLPIPENMPYDALPQSDRRGRLSYTVVSKSGASIEVLLKGNAFRIKKCAKDFPKPEMLQCGWGKKQARTIDDAWKWAKDTTGYTEPLIPDV